MSPLARKERELFQTNTTSSSRGYIAATFALLNHDHAAYRDICRVMLLEHHITGQTQALERTAKICLLGCYDVPEVLLSGGARLLAAFWPEVALRSSCPGAVLWWPWRQPRLGWFEECLHWLDRTEQSWGPLVYTEAMRAMVEHAIGHTAAARRLLDAAESQVGGDVDNYIHHMASGADTGASTDALFSASLLREAKSRIILDAAFPAQPFAGGALAPVLPRL